MKTNLDNIILDRSDFNSLSDIIGNVFDKWDSSDDELTTYWCQLPEEIKLDAIKWGITDTPTRENIYTFLQEKHGK